MIWFLQVLPAKCALTLPLLSLTLIRLQLSLIRSVLTSLKGLMVCRLVCVLMCARLTLSVMVPFLLFPVSTCGENDVLLLLLLLVKGTLQWLLQCEIVRLV